MSGRDRLRAALSGVGSVAFAPRAWNRLPAFVRAAAGTPDDFWRNPGLAHRMLADAAMVCAADGLVFPLLPGGRPAGSPQELLTDPAVEAAVALVERLRAVASHGLLVGLPTLPALGATWPDAVVEDVEDALSDLVRAGLEAGGDAIVVHGERAEVEASLTTVAPLAAYYGAPALGVAGAEAWSAAGGLEVGLLGQDGRWPDLGRGVVLTSGDVTEWWSPEDVRQVLAGRARD